MSAGKVLGTAYMQGYCTTAASDDGMFGGGKQMHQLAFIIIAKVLLYSSQSVKMMIELLVKLYLMEEMCRTGWMNLLKV